MSYKVSPVLAQVCALINAEGALKEGVIGSVSNISFVDEERFTKPVGHVPPVNRHERRKQAKLRRQGR